MSNPSLPMSRVRIFLALGIIGAIVLLFYRLRDPGSSPEKTEEAIRKVLSDQAEVRSRGDLEGYMAGYSQSDELTFFSGGNVRHGKQEVYERYRWRYKTTHFDQGYTNVLALAMSARLAAPGGAPLGALPQELAAVGIMYSEAYVPEMGKLRFEDVQVTLIDAKTAIVRGRWGLTYKRKEPDGGLFTLLFRKEDNQWWIVHDHTSSAK